MGWVWIVRHAVLLQARNALQFSSSAAAEVAAPEFLVAAFLHEINAVLAVAYVSKRSLLVTLAIGVKFLSAKTALAGFLVVLELLACASNVVGLHSARAAEIALALVASHAVLAHVLSRFAS